MKDTRSHAVQVTAPPWTNNIVSLLYLGRLVVENNKVAIADVEA